MLLDLTTHEVEVLFDLVTRACPDQPREGPDYEALDALYGFLGWKLGYTPVEPERA